MSKRYKISQFAKKEGVTVRTVWNWISSGKVSTERTVTGGWLIVEDIPLKKEKVCVYARVSSSENKTNLDSQADRLLSYCAAKGYVVEGVVKEIGSGLNDNRPKLEKILLDDSITKIVVEHKDRLARFGLNYIEKLLSLNGRSIEYINNSKKEDEDIIEDFVSIITSFCARIYGHRRSKRSTEKLIQSLKISETEEQPC